MSITLYSYWRSSCSYRVRIVLNIKHLQYSYKPISLLEGTQLTPEYAAINPACSVPALVVDGVTLTQSPAIVEFLEERFPEVPLLPRDLVLRCRVREICALISNDIQPVGNMRVLNHMAKLDTSPDAKGIWSRHFMALGFRALEALLKNSAGKYAVGDELSLADAFMVPQVYNATRWKLDMLPYPTVMRVNAALLEVPEFVAAAPSEQPDADRAA